MIACPQCAMSVNAEARHCQHCGADLGLAAAVVERQFLPWPGGAVGQSLAPEILAPRLGEQLIEQGVLTAGQLDQALAFQQESLALGRPLLLGQALLAMDLVSREALDQAITVQIFQLQAALKTANRTLEERIDARTTELHRALERLAELSQLKANFIANISHELRTPLTHIKGYLDLFTCGCLGETTPAQEDALAVLNRAEARLERLIENLIQFSLASCGELALQLEQVNLAHLAQAIAERTAPAAARKGLALVTDLQQSVPAVPGDPEKLGWVVAQLVDNAIKFTPAPGQVSIAACPQPGAVQLVVSDTGIGIPDGRLDEIFEPFHQLDGSATRRYPGAGLGLAMVQRILAAHQTHLQVKSCAGHGSAFSFNLSASPPAGGG